SKGAYTLISVDKPDLLLLATGSEVSIAVQAAEKLAMQGIKTQVVSMPSWELFEKQDQAYKDTVIPPNVKARVAIEAAVELGWCKYLGDKGVFIGMTTFGASAPGKVCFENFGITVDKTIQAAKNVLQECRLGLSQD
ncbi:MAG: transketolase, partial [Candidatus Brocadiia bacterium]